MPHLPTIPARRTIGWLGRMAQAADIPGIRCTAAAPTLADLDAQLASEGFMRDPYPALRELRERAPVSWSETLGAWLLTPRIQSIVDALLDGV